MSSKNNTTTQIIPSDCYTSSYNAIDEMTKAIKIFGFILNVTVLSLPIFVKKLRNIHMTLFLNITATDVFALSSFGLAAFNAVCDIVPYSRCLYESIIAYYLICLYAFGVLALSIYRLLCASVYNINRYMTPRNMVITLIVIWTIPIGLVIVPAISFNFPVFYNYAIASCRFDLSNNKGFFIYYVLVSNVLPAVSIIIIDFLIFFKLKKSKSRVGPTNFNTLKTTAKTKFEENGNNLSNSKAFSVQLRFSIQLLLLFLVFEMYATITGIFFYETCVVYDKYRSIDNVKILKCLRWAYHILNPIVFLLSHPTVFGYLKSKLISIKPK